MLTILNCQGIVTIQPCHLGFAQLTLLTAAYAAKSSIRAKRPMSEDEKNPLQASLRQFFSSSAARLNSYREYYTL